MFTVHIFLIVENCRQILLRVSDQMHLTVYRHYKCCKYIHENRCGTVTPQMA